MISTFAIIIILTIFLYKGALSNEKNLKESQYTNFHQKIKLQTYENKILNGEKGKTLSIEAAKSRVIRQYSQQPSPDR